MSARPVAAHLRLASGLPERGGNLSVGLEVGTPPPSWLRDRVARAEWRRVLQAANGTSPRWLQRADTVVLAMYCDAFAIYRHASEDVAERGHLVPGRSSADQAGRVWVKNPSVAIRRDAGTELRRLIAELGFSPATRVRVDVGPTEPADSDLFD